jgi:nucleotide-binding universal stress UspA family protein
MESRLKFLLATDYSEAAGSAENYAVQLARNLNAILVFFHVYQLSDTSAQPMGFAGDPDELHRNELKRLNKHCDELVRSLPENAGDLVYECIVREGSNIEKQINKEAELLNADFIVVGTHGISGFRRLFFGSRAWGVIKKSSRPVFAIPKGAFFTDIKNIVFGTEYREGETSGLNFLIHFAKLLDAHVTVLHITNYVLTKRFETEMFEKFKNEVVSKLLYSKISMHLMVSENISDGVHKFCTKNKTDLLVMSPKKPFIFENYFMTNMSMTRKTIFSTRIPLLAIPDFYASEHSSFWDLADVAGYVSKGR